MAGAVEELVLRVKMIDGREIEVEVRSDGRIADVAEKVLEAEDAPMHKMIRLIYGGRLLQPQDTIAAYNISSQVVIHAVITDVPFHAPHNDVPQHGAAHGAPPSSELPRRPNPTAQWAANSGAARAGGEEQLEGMLLKVPPGILLALLWWVFLARGRDLFSWFSTLSLVILTFLYLSYTLPRSINGPASAIENAVLAIYSYVSAPPPPPGGRPHHDVSPLSPIPVCLLLPATPACPSWHCRARTSLWRG
jgi:hypothetical protein